jgi:hypothetical protein
MPLPVFVSETIHQEAIDWARRVSANGGTISTSVIRAVSDFCAAIDRGGLRDRFARLNVFSGGNLSGALVPLYRSTAFGGTLIGNATDTNVNFVSGDYAEAGASSGIKGNGTTKYLDTGVNANTYSANNWHIGVGLRATQTGSAAFKCLAGAYNNANNGLEIDARRSGTAFGDRAAFFTRFATATDLFGDDVNTAALATGDIVAAWPSMYRNGTASGITATTSQNYPSAHKIYVFALNNSNSSAINHTDARLNWYSLGQTMTATQVAAFSTAVAALNTALGR